MNALQSFNTNNWNEEFPTEMQNLAINSLENGHVLYFPTLTFELSQKEQHYLSAAYADPKNKNISFNPLKNTINGVIGSIEDKQCIQNFMQRFSLQAQTIIQTLLPCYASSLQQGRTSFRPVEISGRATSYRQDDTRLHVDAFPSSPNQGKRILRFFSNINPQGQDRVWRIGEPFEEVAKKFLPKIKSPLPGISTILKTFKITKSKRTPYDHFMLHIHDGMKADLNYQKNAPQTEIKFPAGCSWIVMTDDVSHAAMKGQFALEQTFYLPVHAMQDGQHAPLRVLERLINRTLT